MGRAVRGVTTARGTALEAYDIGLTRLRLGIMTMLCVGAGMLAGWAASLAFGFPVLEGVMLGALPAFLCCFVVADDRAGRIAARGAVLWVPFTAALVAAVLLQRFRVLELVVLVLLLTAQLGAAALKVWIADAGVGAFSAFLCGLLLPLSDSSLVSIPIVFALSLGLTVGIRSVFFRPNSRRALRHARRGFTRLTEAVLAATADLLEAESPREHARRSRRVSRRVRRMQEAALIADGLVAREDSGLRGRIAHGLHRAVFDTELATETIASTALAMAPLGLDARRQGADALRAVIALGGGLGAEIAPRLLAGMRAAGIDESTDAGRAARRIATAIDDLTGIADARERAMDLPDDDREVPFDSAVTLFAGRPTGAGPVLDATLERGGMAGPWRRLTPKAATRNAVQGLIAVAIAEPLGLLVGGDRFYWAVIGVIVILAGTSSTHDRARKTWSRAWGTVLGGVVGIPLALLLAADAPWAVAPVAALSLGLGVFFISARYGLWTTFLILALCQVYAATAALTADLLALRLAENLLGAVAALIVSALVLPVSGRAMVRTAIDGELDAIGQFLERVGASTSVTASAPAADPGLRRAARAVDLADFRLASVVRPLVVLRSSTIGRGSDRARTSLGRAALYVGYLAAQPPVPGVVPADERARIEGAVASISASIADARAAVLERGSTRVPWTGLDDAELAAAGLETTALPTVTAARSWAEERMRLLGRLDESLAGLAAQGD